MNPLQALLPYCVFGADRCVQLVDRLPAWQAAEPCSGRCSKVDTSPRGAAAVAAAGEHPEDPHFVRSPLDFRWTGLPHTEKWLTPDHNIIIYGVYETQWTAKYLLN